MIDLSIMATHSIEMPPSKRMQSNKPLVVRNVNTDFESPIAADSSRLGGLFAPKETLDKLGREAIFDHEETLATHKKPRSVAGFRTTY
jgi:hypothetical protein